MDEFLWKHLKSEHEYVHFISLSYSILNDLNIEHPYFNSHKKIVNSIELLKASTLIIDDIIDSTTQRNNTDSVVAHYGISKAILTGEQLKSHSTIAFVEALKELPIDDRAIVDCLLIFEDSFRTVSFGQLEDIEKLYFKPTMIDWNIEDWQNYYKEYLAIIYKTTSVFIQIPYLISYRIGSIKRKEYSDYLSFFQNIGIAYQLRDDIIDSVGEEFEIGKSKGGDIIEKKIRLPLIEFFRKRISKPQKADLLKFYTKEKLNIADVENLISLLYETGSIDASIKVLNNYCQMAINSIGNVTNSSHKEYLSNLAQFVML
jgi:heptaprenyl diphosphate synthase